MAATADLGEMTRMWASEQYIGHWDGYSVRTGVNWPNNYYLHSDEAGRFSMLPTGIDETFHDADPFPGTGQGVLITRCRGDASCLADFRSRLGDVSAAADAMPVGARLDAIAATVAPWRDCPHLEQATDPGWQQAVKGTRQFIRNRRIAVASYLGRPAPAPVPALESTAPPAISPTGCPFAPHPPPKDPDPDPEPTPTSTPTPAAPPPPPPPAAGGVLGATASSPRRVRPHRLTLRARRGARLRVSGALRLPAGARCGGRVAVRVDAGGAMLAMREVFVHRDCGCAARFRVPRRGALIVRARFLGTSRLAPRSGRAAGRSGLVPGLDPLRAVEAELAGVGPPCRRRPARAGSRRGRRRRARSSTRPTKRFGQPSSSGTPPGPASHATRANLSTSSPVSPPNSSARPGRAPGTKCTPSSSRPAPTR